VKFTQYYLDCLSQASYLVADEDSGIAAVVDPRRDIQTYLDDAAADGLEIRYVIETHFHADFLSGHLELAEATGAEIVYGAAAKAEFPIRHVRDGERISLGSRDGSGDAGVVLEFRETPGHTPESISVVVWERADDPEPFGVLTGDTLFIGDVGRPDLLASVGVTADELARLLYTSVHDRLMVLPDSTRVFPAHGAGSACGKNLSAETASTIGEQRRTNYAVQPMGVDQFVAAVTEGQIAAPEYFGYDAGLNKADRQLLDTAPPQQLTLDEVLAQQAAGAVVVDTREPAEFARGHLVGSVNVGLEGRYAEYVGTVVPPGTPIVLVTEPGAEGEAKLRLARIGFDSVVGALAGGAPVLAERPGAVAPASRLTVAQLDERRAELPVQLVDVRNPGEVALGTVPGADIISLADIRTRASELELDRPIVVYCEGGYRSSIAASLLRSLGATDVSDLIGGYTAWSTTPHAVN
jgi:glyoxylase-like metal-dependent hydrolase (beta-lactamase superfamily II)/rhodanese-related sulfurtransferase